MPVRPADAATAPTRSRSPTSTATRIWTCSGATSSRPACCSSRTSARRAARRRFRWIRCCCPYADSRTSGYNAPAPVDLDRRRRSRFPDGRASAAAFNPVRPPPTTSITGRGRRRIASSCGRRGSWTASISAARRCPRSAIWTATAISISSSAARSIPRRATPAGCTSSQRGHDDRAGVPAGGGAEARRRVSPGAGARRSRRRRRPRTCSSARGTRTSGSSAIRARAQAPAGSRSRPRRSARRARACRAPALADLDGDKDLDLLVGQATRRDRVLSQRRQRQGAEVHAGERAPRRHLRPGRRSAPALVDLDGDGLLDLVVGRETGGAGVYRNAGTRTAPKFVEREGLALPLPPSSSPVFADLDGDKRLDVLSGTASGGLVFLRGS